MLTWAITFLILAMFAGVFGVIAIGPAGLLFFGVFFALFVWAMVRHRYPRPPRDSGDDDR